jgi:hypothetical protein
MSFYKMIEDRVELARRLEALVEENAEATARALAAFFAPLAESVPEQVLYEDELLRQRLLVRWVAKVRREMADAAAAHQAAERELEALRVRRDEAVAATYAELVEIRRQARGLLGKKAPSVLGLSGRTRRKPRPLARQARTAVRWLSEPVTAPPAGSGLAVRQAIWLEDLEPLRELLEPAIEAVIHGEATTLVTLRDKRRAMKEFDRHFGNVGRYVLVTYQLVGRDDLAALVPQREPRKSRRKSKTRPPRQPRSAAASDRGPLADVVDLGRWVKQRLLRLGTGLRRRA